MRVSPGAGAEACAKKERRCRASENPCGGGRHRASAPDIVLISPSWALASAQRQTRYLAAYYLGWGGCLLHAFLRGASRAAPVQLSVCALVALAIPLSSWLGPWAHGSTWGVDLGALILALALAWAARLTRRRLAGADPDTVWARGVAQVQRLN